MQSMKNLVAGATGKVGGRVVHRLLREGHEACILVRNQQLLDTPKIKDHPGFRPISPTLQSAVVGNAL